MVVKSVLITGASRGIGLEFVNYFLSLSTPPKHIFATCRNPNNAQELQALASKHPQMVHIHQLDVLDYSSHPRVVQWVEGVMGEGEGLTVLVNNAGQFTSAGNKLDDVSRESMLSELETNAVAPLLLSKVFLPLLRKAAATAGGDSLSVSRAAILNISSSMGSIGENGSGGRYAYRSSKAALNMISKSLSVDLKSDGILVAILHPGWVKTGMGGDSALIDTQTSVQGMMKTVATLATEQTGSHYNYRGEIVPW